MNSTKLPKRPLIKLDLDYLRFGFSSYCLILFMTPIHQDYFVLVWKNCKRDYLGERNLKL